jgi:hypothetical protein
MSTQVKTVKKGRSRKRAARKRAGAQKQVTGKYQVVTGGRQAEAEMAKRVAVVEQRVGGLSTVDLNWLNVLTNPMGSDTGGAKLQAPHIPKRDDSKTLGVTLTTSIVLPSTTATTGAINVQEWNYTDGLLVAVVYGADPNTITNTPTTVVPGYAQEQTIMAALCGAGTQVRVVGCGLRVVLVANTTTTGGSFEPYQSSGAFCTASGVFRSYAALGMADGFGSAYDYTTGVTVRAPYGAGTNDAWATRQTYQYNASGSGRSMPGIRFSGLSGSILIQVAQHLEVKNLAAALPIPLVDWPDSENFEKLQTMAADPDEFPLYSKGNSFASVFKKLGGLAKKVAKAALGNPAATLAMLGL